MIENDDVPDAAPTMEQALRGGTTEPPPSGDLYGPTCFACGRETPRRETSMSEPPLPRIATMEHNAVDAELRALLDEGGGDERRVMLFVARRLIALGQRAYGVLDIGSDPRNFMRERNEEIGDQLVYTALDALKQELRR